MHDRPLASWEAHCQVVPPEIDEDDVVNEARSFRQGAFPQPLFQHIVHWQQGFHPMPHVVRKGRECQIQQKACARHPTSLHVSTGYSCIILFVLYCFHACMVYCWPMRCTAVKFMSSSNTGAMGLQRADHEVVIVKLCILHRQPHDACVHGDGRAE